MNLRRQVRQRARAILQIVQQEKCTALVACSGDAIDMPAAFLASQWANVAFYPYMFDDYAQQWVTAFQRRFAHTICQRIMKESAGVVVPNEFLARTYRAIYQVDSVVVPNPIEDLLPLTRRASPRSTQALRIVYTGAVYEAHFDAFTSLIQTLGLFPAKNVQLHIYTQCDASFLFDHGIGEPAVVHPHVTSTQAQELQRAADVLFLPLAFASPFPDIIRTSAPGKMGELLGSGRPILVHAPRDCFVSWYCRHHACAAVVDDRDPELLKRTLLRLREDPEWTASLVRNAWQRAHEDFGLIKARDRFFQLIAGSVRNGEP